jgi:hypothetical protein
MKRLIGNLPATMDWPSESVTDCKFMLSYAMKITSTIQLGHKTKPSFPTINKSVYLLFF